MGSAIRQADRRWESAIIPYVIHPEVTGVNAIYTAFAFWESRTNVRFVRRYLQSDYLEFVLDAGAVGYSYSKIGKIGGRQVLASSQSFDARTFMHEIGHALGLFHEQERSDRDEFVKINFDNIPNDKKHNFNKESDSLNSDSYDFRSIMHYSAYSFAINPAIPTIEPIDAGISLNILGSSQVPTTQDIRMVNFIYPKMGVVRRSSSQNGAGEVKEIASLVIAPSRLVTAVRTASNKLKMILWSIDSLGGIRRVSPVDDANTAGEASNISIAQAGNNIVTAMRNGSNDLYLISWQLQNGQLVRKANSGTLAGDATVIKIINLTTSVLLTACRADNGDLKLILWRVDPSGQFTRVADSGAQAGEISEVSLIKLRQNNVEHIVATTVKAGNDSIKTITWAVSIASNTITRRGNSDSQIGKGSLIQSAISAFGHLIISCKSASNNLLLISVSISATGREIHRLADSHSMAGEIKANSLITRTYGAISGVADGSGNLKLIKWAVNSAGQFTRLGDSANGAGAIGAINLEAFQSNPEAPLCTPVKNGDGNLFVITWDDESQAGELDR